MPISAFQCCTLLFGVQNQTLKSWDGLGDKTILNPSPQINLRYRLSVLNSVWRCHCVHHIIIAHLEYLLHQEATPLSTN